MVCFLFFFSSRRRHTRWPRDWSSDVCSSDLNVSEERNITIEVTGKVEAEIAHIDLDQMDQVITNLLDNAIRHMDDGGNINICVNNDVEQLEIEVSDDGYGIAEDDLPFIFERFYKADKSRTRDAKERGTGLGLAIVKNIIEAHEGEITAQSIINEGTTFHITIPNQ